MEYYPVPPPLNQAYIYIGIPLILWIILILFILYRRGYFKGISGYISLYERMPWVRPITHPYLLLALAIAISWLLIPHYAIYIGVDKNEVYIFVPNLLISRHIRSSDIINVSIINIDKSSIYKPVIRVFAAGTQGYRVGWFKLADGEDALIIARGSKALVIRLRNGVIILAPENFNSFIKSFSRNVYPIEGVK